MSNRSSLLPCLRLLCIAAAGFFATGQAAVAEPQEMKVVEHADTDAVTDTGAEGDSAGDILTFANEVYDADDKNKVGSRPGHLLPHRGRQGLGVLLDALLGQGSDHRRGPVPRCRRTPSLAITGGTGEFAGATGDMALSAIGTDGKAYDFVYRIK